MRARTESTVYYPVTDDIEIKRHWSHETPVELPDDTRVRGKRVMISENAMEAILVSIFTEELAQLFPHLEIDEEAFDCDIGAVWTFPEEGEE